MNIELKQKKQDLGIFYTDLRIVNFIYDILFIWKEKEEKETGRWESRNHYPSVIDPAVGEGAFLKVALERGFTTPKYVFGVDIDEEAKEKWIAINLLKSFGSKAELDNHFYHQNGLIPLDETKVFRHKKGGLREFDAVVGNPPYGGIGVNFSGQLNIENKNLLNALQAFEIFSYRVNKIKSDEAQGNLFDFSEVNLKASLNKSEIIRQSQGTPVEILFVERFIQLAKPGAWIAVIIPDGVLTNSNAHFVRQFIADRAKVEAIVSLPRDAFKHAGTSAKTSILFLQKLKDTSSNRNLEYPVFLASVEVLEDGNFQKITQLYKEFYNDQ